MKSSVVSFVPLFVLSCAGSAWAEEPRPAGRLGGFVDLEWRAFGLAGHFSHGPAFAAGVSLWDGTLRLGLGGLNRPGPWNPASFEVTLPNGASYRGQRTLALRSDGAMAGLHMALAFAVPDVPWLSVTLPVTLGYGGFGFYLQGDDRNTPDGRRVSEWENELFAGRDSHLGMVIDSGVRLNLEATQDRWLRPYAALYYTTVPGFDTLARDGYAGFSAALGVEVGHGL